MVLAPPQSFAHFAGDAARHDVGGAAGRVGHDKAYRARGVGGGLRLRRRAIAQRQQYADRANNMESFHDFIPANGIAFRIAINGIVRD
jgi:hypothetical protein